MSLHIYYDEFEYYIHMTIKVLLKSAYGERELGRRTSFILDAEYAKFFEICTLDSHTMIFFMDYKK